MLKAGVYALLALGIFTVVFALLPAPPSNAARTGATLEGVSLSLYPARDADAVWRFRAAHVTNDPLRGETRLTGLSNGGRWIRQPGSPPVLDATLRTSDLTIDAQDNMLTRQASITLVQQCADIDLRGTEEQPVRVEQGYGFSAPVAEVDSPSLTGRVTRMRMTFDFNVEDSGEDSTLGWNPDATETCENGKRVPLGSPAKET
ncbi:hypothetical protein [Deinococcus sp. YIM 77859]|uniref:hypothetical protein n=1 Tax=Deinococcus sp. YIM 77859 TaxID=1540221 RepID=UPI0005543E67|nr:hypothetical protein [Deinococcus sp. YIM 77859]